MKSWVLHKILESLVDFVRKFFFEASDLTLSDELEVAADFPISIETFCHPDQRVVVAWWVLSHWVDRKMLAKLVDFLLWIISPQKRHRSFHNRIHVRLHVFVKHEQNVRFVAKVPEVQHVLIERRVNYLIAEKSFEEVSLCSFVSDDMPIVVKKWYSHIFGVASHVNQLKLFCKCVRNCKRAIWTQFA